MEQNSASATIDLIKLKNAHDLPRFMKDMTRFVMEKYAPIYIFWVENGNIPGPGVDPIPPANPGARPALQVVPGAHADAIRELREVYRDNIKTFEYNVNEYKNYENYSIGLIGFILNHLENNPLDRVRKHADFQTAYGEKSFRKIWNIVVVTHQLTGAAKLAETMELEKQFHNISIIKNEDIDTYCHRFDEQLGQLLNREALEDGPKVATIFLKGLLNSPYRNMSISALSREMPVENSGVAMTLARNYQAFIEVETTESSNAAINELKKNKWVKQNAQPKSDWKGLNEEEKFKKKQLIYKSKSQIRCFECGKVGHPARLCKINNKKKEKIKNFDEETHSSKNVVNSDISDSETDE